MGEYSYSVLLFRLWTLMASSRVNVYLYTVLFLNDNYFMHTHIHKYYLH